MMFDGHEDLFLFSNDKSVSSTNGFTGKKGKSNKGQNLDQNINERRIV